MKANDLMIGDWVYIPHNGKAPHYGKVTALLSSGAIETEINGSLALSSSVEPIPLTAEILKKNGLLDDAHSEYWVSFSKHDEEWYLHYYGAFAEMKVSVSSVHELQHCLKLVGIEKEIVI